MKMKVREAGRAITDTLSAFLYLLSENPKIPVLAPRTILSHRFIHQRLQFASRQIDALGFHRF